MGVIGYIVSGSRGWVVFKNIVKKFELKSLIKEAPCGIEDNLGPDLLERFKNTNICK